MIKEWNGKRYHSLNYFLRNKFGEKIYKISLDGGFTCPNRDGKVAKGGCTFCSARGSGDFKAGRPIHSVLICFSLQTCTIASVICGDCT